MENPRFKITNFLSNQIFGLKKISKLKRGFLLLYETYLRHLIFNGIQMGHMLGN